MASENSLWRNLRKKMIPRYWQQATRHEDKLSTGIADVSFVQDYNHGWMELKHRSLAPARASTIVRLDHYTDDQRIFLLEKGETGGNTFLFLQLERDYLLFNHQQAQAVGHLTKADLYNHANWYCCNGLDAFGLFDAIGGHG